MSEVVERVALAISESFREEGAFWDGRWESESERAAFHNAARAAIAELREPSGAMVLALLKDRFREDTPHHRDEITVDWQVMVDAALKG